jgi:hypothetical protein
VTTTRTAVSPHTASATPSPAKTTTPSTAKTATNAATAGHSTAAAKVAAATKRGATTPAGNAAKAPAKGEVMATSVQSLGARFMEQREQYVYDSLNRRDPFASLVSGSFETEVGTPLLDVSSMKLVGIVWGPTDKFALVEDGHGHGFVLRVGDPVLNGYIAGLTKEELIVKQSSYGDTQTVTIQLQRKDGASNAQ